MFTGLVEAMGTVHSTEPQQGGLRLCLEVPQQLVDRLSNGDSLAVNGLCLTLVQKNDCLLSFDVIRESLQRSNLGDLVSGDSVNLETATRLGEPLGGHLVSGHIDCTGTVTEFLRNGEVVLRVSVAEDWGRYLFAKGSIALNGVSLTLAEVEAEARGQRQFGVCLIPETLKATNLDGLVAGDRVNVETDQIARYVVETVSRIG